MLERLDKVLVDRGFAQSRTQAQKLVDAGVVSANLYGRWVVLTKPAQKIAEDAALQVGEIDELKFVSRAGLKLDLALRHIGEQGLFPAAGFPLNQCSALDIGQSTGGFTDCLLQWGVPRVVGLDVGHDQLAEKLRQHPSVICLEGINARDMPVDAVLAYCPAGFDLVVMDVSFISQTLILAKIPALLKRGGFLLSLVKPQFEVGAKNLSRGGIVRNAALYDTVQTRITECARTLELDVIGFFESGIAGGDGNREFFMLCQKP